MFASVFVSNRIMARPVGLCLAASLLLAACGGPEPAPRIAAPQRPQLVTETDDPQPQATAPETLPAEAEALAVQDAKPVLIGLMLPLSGSEAATGEALLRAATMALFDAYDPRLQLLPLDTAGDFEVAEMRAREAIEAGVSIVLGPLLAANVEAAGDILGPAGITMLGFSNDSSAAGPGRFLMGFLPEAEVKRVVDYTVGAGHQNFGALLPFGRYGDRVRTAFGDAIADAGAEISAIEAYPPDADALFEPVKRLARYDERRDDVRQEVRFLRSLRDDVTDEIAKSLEDAEVMEGVEFDAVLVPEGGALMRTLAPLLPFYEIDPNRVKLIGTGLWNDPGLLGEPPLQGGWFAAPDPVAPAAFLDRFEAMFGEQPPRIATLSYDAVALVARFAREPLSGGLQDKDPGLATLSDPRFAAERFVTNEGFKGLDGLFRFLEDGTIERALAVLEVNRRGFEIIDPAPNSFPAFGYALKDATR